MFHCFVLHAFVVRLFLSSFLLAASPLIATNNCSCPGPKYTRDYTSLCPQGWLLQANGSCWGRSYRGCVEFEVYMHTPHRRSVQCSAAKSFIIILQSCLYTPTPNSVFALLAPAIPCTTSVASASLVR